MHNRKEHTPLCIPGTRLTHTSVYTTHVLLAQSLEEISARLNNLRDLWPTQSNYHASKAPILNLPRLTVARLDDNSLSSLRLLAGCGQLMYASARRNQLKSVRSPTHQCFSNAL